MKRHFFIFSLNNFMAHTDKTSARMSAICKMRAESVVIFQRFAGRKMSPKNDFIAVVLLDYKSEIIHSSLFHKLKKPKES